ncbi:hypothetical protein GYH30_027208 [Glycine max]|uniref:ATP-dependent DNA helicase n=1 Tax=Glycine max TaxID=3847 RepID=A0A0R0HQ98_SOYBN|nr:hypothetical protein GYH30_027208 [Glycine max]
MTVVDRQECRIYFLYDYGGTGKTFMWKTLTSTLRSQRQIVLVPTFDNSICNIHQGSELAELLKVTKLIIWDEAPMAHKFCFEALDKSLRDIMGLGNESSTIFGGKVIAFGRDFHQILPVIPRGSRSYIIHSTINASYIWDHYEMLILKKNMCLQSSMDNLYANGIFFEPNDGYAIIEIPQELLILDFNDLIHGIVSSTYPNLMDQYNKEEYLQCKAILASTTVIVDEINDYVLSLVLGGEKEYLSLDMVDKSDAAVSQAWEALTPEFLNSLRTSGLPNDKIKLKVGSPIMVLRNIDQFEGLCNDTRLIGTRLANHVFQAKIIDGNKNGNMIYIPRMCMSLSQSPCPFKLIRRQFPIMLSYAMTINKSQDQSLECVGIYLVQTNIEVYILL